jgi:hypothetical protein
MNPNGADVIWQILEPFVRGVPRYEVPDVVMQLWGSCSPPREIDELLTEYVKQQDGEGLLSFARAVAAKHLLDLDRHILLVASLLEVGAIESEKAVEFLDFIRLTLDSPSKRIRAVLQVAFAANHELRDNLTVADWCIALSCSLKEALHAWRTDLEA